MDKLHIGDGVYVSLENNMIRMDANNPDNPSDTIFLELNVYLALCDWVERQTARISDDKMHYTCRTCGKPIDAAEGDDNGGQCDACTTTEYEERFFAVHGGAQ